MELDGAKKCFTFIQDKGFTISTFVSDRHLSLGKWIRETQSCKHLIDIWHVSKSLCKKLTRASKEKDCGIIGEWITGIRNHLYWCALSTPQGFGEMILAKWMSLLRHIADKHHNHPNPLFPCCAHGDIDKRKWIKIGIYHQLYLHICIIVTM